MYLGYFNFNVHKYYWMGLPLFQYSLIKMNGKLEE